MFQTAKSLLILLMPLPSFFFRQKSCFKIESWTDSYVISFCTLPFLPHLYFLDVIWTTFLGFHLNNLSWLSYNNLEDWQVCRIAAMLPFNPRLQSVDNPLLCTAWQSDPGWDDLKTIEFLTLPLISPRVIWSRLSQVVARLQRTSFLECWCWRTGEDSLRRCKDCLRRCESILTP